MKAVRTTHPGFGVGACWALLWRSVVYCPLMLLVFAIIGGIWLSRWMLPLFVLGLAFAGLWNHAGISLLAWITAIWAYRHFRLRRLFEEPPSLL
jgi:hypothetical protein